MTDILLASAVAATFGAAVYLMLSRSVIRLTIGAAMLSNAVNLAIFTLGRADSNRPPLLKSLDDAQNQFANPLPQALILTAVVIGFALFAAMLAVGFRAYRETNADDTENMRIAEPRSNPPTPEDLYDQEEPRSRETSTLTS